MTQEITTAELNKFIQAIQKNSGSDGDIFYLGNLLEIKPVFTHDKEGNKTLEGIDIYKYADKELMEDEDYDFDSDYITTIYL